MSNDSTSANWEHPDPEAVRITEEALRKAAVGFTERIIENRIFLRFASLTALHGLLAGRYQGSGTNSIPVAREAWSIAKDMLNNEPKGKS